MLILFHSSSLSIRDLFLDYVSYPLIVIIIMNIISLSMQLKVVKINLALLSEKSRIVWPCIWVSMAIQELVRFYADYRINLHASLRLLRDRLIFLLSVLQPYSQGGMVSAIAAPVPSLRIPITIHIWLWGVSGYLILFHALTFVSERQSFVR